MAQDTATVSYTNCAVALRDSIMRMMPDAQVTIITELPHGDLAPDSDWKLINDWQVYEASPYEYTIKLEADMLITSDISYWWDVLSSHDLVISSTIRNFKGEISSSKAYRKFIVDNDLPDVYNAITYFRKSTHAEEFFLTVRNIFENWDQYKEMLKCNDIEEATTDWVYSIAAHIIGVETCTLPDFVQMSMVHMKQYINNLATSDWTNELVYEFTPESFKVNTFPQTYPFHYHVKEFSDTILNHYG